MSCSSAAARNSCSVVGELVCSLVLVACFWPTLIPSNWRNLAGGREERLALLIALGLEVSGILGTLHALARLT
jgi:hypothetical protein